MTDQKQKMKITKPMSMRFGTGQIVDMQIINDRGDFRLSASGFSQLFGFLYQIALVPMVFQVVITEDKSKDD